MTDKRTIPLNRLDKRIIHKRLISGSISEQELAAYWSTLPDVADQGETIPVRLERRPHVAEDPEDEAGAPE